MVERAPDTGFIFQCRQKQKQNDKGKENILRFHRESLGIKRKLFQQLIPTIKKTMKFMVVTKRSHCIIVPDLEFHLVVCGPQMVLSSFLRVFLTCISIFLEKFLPYIEMNLVWRAVSGGPPEILSCLLP